MWLAVGIELGEDVTHTDILELLEGKTDEGVEERDEDELEALVVCSDMVVAVKTKRLEDRLVWGNFPVPMGGYKDTTSVVGTGLEGNETSGAETVISSIARIPKTSRERLKR